MVSLQDNRLARPADDPLLIVDDDAGSRCETRRYHAEPSRATVARPRGRRSSVSGVTDRGADGTLWLRHPSSSSRFGVSVRVADFFAAPQNFSSHRVFVRGRDTPSTYPGFFFSTRNNSSLSQDSSHLRRRTLPRAAIPSICAARPFARPREFPFPPENPSRDTSATHVPRMSIRCPLSTPPALPALSHTSANPATAGLEQKTRASHPTTLRTPTTRSVEPWTAC